MKKILLVFLISSNLQILAQEDDDCVFDRSTQTDEFIKGIPEFSNYTWNDKTKTAKILLEDGSKLLARRGGCVHFGISGTLVMQDTSRPVSDLDYWFEKAKWIAKRLFHETDYDQLISSFNDKTFSDFSGSGNTYIMFEHEYYSDFSMVVKIQGNKTELSIGYYF